jgi:UDP-3-O-[3-hydroxymyristoyl] glucosamine N-acyltransferase
MEFTAQQIAGILNGEIEGNEDTKVTNISPIEDGQPGTLTFLANPKYTKYIYTTQASIVLVNKNLQLDKTVNKQRARRSGKDTIRFIGMPKAI